jgi:hypothetical protein
MHRTRSNQGIRMAMAAAGVAMGGVVLGWSWARGPEAMAAEPPVAGRGFALHDGGVRANAQMLGEPPCEVTWDVFLSTAVKVHDLPSGSSCGSGLDIAGMQSDLDQDGTLELILSSERVEEVGFGNFSGGGVLASRRVSGNQTLFVVHDLSRASASYPWIPAQDSIIVFPIACKDMNSDGLPDLVCLVREYGNTPGAVCYFPNRLTPPGSQSNADLNGDGVINGADLTILLVAWGAGS